MALATISSAVSTSAPPAAIAAAAVAGASLMEDKLVALRAVVAGIERSSKPDAQASVKGTLRAQHCHSEINESAHLGR